MNISHEDYIKVAVILELKMLYILQEGLSSVDKEMLLLERISALQNALEDN